MFTILHALVGHTSASLQWEWHLWSVEIIGVAAAVAAVLRGYLVLLCLQACLRLVVACVQFMEIHHGATMRHQKAQQEEHP